MIQNVQKYVNKALIILTLDTYVYFLYKLSLKDKLTEEHTGATVSDDQKLLNPREAFKLEEFVLLTQLNHTGPLQLCSSQHTALQTSKLSRALSGRSWVDGRQSSACSAHYSLVAVGGDTRGPGGKTRSGGAEREKL